MLFTVDVTRLPTVVKCYKIERKTVWTAVDPQNILVFVTDGECVFTVNNIEYIVKKNEAFIIPAEQEYSRKPHLNKPATFYYFHFKTDKPILEADTDAVKQSLEKRKANIEAAIVNDTHGKFESLENIYINNHVILDDKAPELAKKIEKEITLGRIESGFLLSLYFSELLGLVMQNTIKELLTDCNSKTDAPVSHILKKAILYIRQNRKQIITLNDLSSYCGVSPQHMIRLFKAELGITPTQYINRLKITHAKNLIQNNPSLSMKEISYELGFENPNYFSRLFTKLEGENPSDFKLRISIPGNMYKDGTAIITAHSLRSKKYKE